MKLITIRDGLALLQDKNTFFVYNEHEINPADVSELTPHDDLECRAIVEILPTGKIKTLTLSELYQFNCCNSLLSQIKLIAYGLEQNGFSVPNTAQFDEPAKFEPQGISKMDYRLEETHGCPGAVFYLEFKGHTIRGTGTFIKYWFFEGIEEAVSSVEDIMSLYVAVSKLIAFASHEAKDTSFLQCDEWIAGNKYNGAYYTHHLRSEFLNCYAEFHASRASTLT